jgi:hypothetical protein
MNKQNIINFYQSSEALYYLQHMISQDLLYPQVAEELSSSCNVYLPQDQYLAYKMVLDIQMELDTGHRREEIPHGCM